MPVSKQKSKAKKRDGPTAARMRKATHPVRSPKQKKERVMDEFNEQEKKQNEEAERRRADAESRGAGSGENAVRTRTRKGGTATGGPKGFYETGGTQEDSGTGGTGDAEEYGGNGGGKDDDDEEIELPQDMFPQGKTEDDYKPENYNPESEFPPGNASKGMPDYTKVAQGVQQHIPMRDLRAYLVSQAVKNERANDEANARFVKGLKGQEKAIGILLNPDYMRDKAVESTFDHMDDPMHAKEYIENFKKQRAKEQREAAAAAGAIAGAAQQTAGAGTESETEEEE